MWPSYKSEKQRSDDTIRSGKSLEEYAQRCCEMLGFESFKFNSNPEMYKELMKRERAMRVEKKRVQEEEVRGGAGRRMEGAKDGRRKATSAYYYSTITNNLPLVASLIADHETIGCVHYREKEAEEVENEQGHIRVKEA